MSMFHISIYIVDAFTDHPNHPNKLLEILQIDPLYIGRDQTNYLIEIDLRKEAGN